MATYDRKDRLYRQAKEEGYRSRAAYKLLELNEKLHWLRPGARVLDLGSFPGGWVQVAAQKSGPKGLVFGVDLKEITPFKQQELGHGVPLPKIFQGDVLDPELQQVILRTAEKPFDLLLCDMSPTLSGVQDRDRVQLAELLECALNLASTFLKKKGSFVAKTFPGNEVDLICKNHRNSFEKLDRTRLKSSRNSSNELYLIGKLFRGPQVA